MARGQKHNDDVKEKVYALLATNNNIAEISRQTGIKETTIRTWAKNLEEGKTKDDKKIVELRSKKKQEFVKNAWKIIDATQKLLERRITRALEEEDAIDNVVKKVGKYDATEDLLFSEKQDIYKTMKSLKLEDVGKLSTVLGTLYDKQALANDESTENVHLSVESYLKQVEGKVDY